MKTRLWFRRVFKRVVVLIKESFKRVFRFKGEGKRVEESRWNRKRWNRKMFNRLGEDKRVR